MFVKESNISTEKHSPIVVFFIYVSIFINSYVFFKEPFEFYFGYLIYLVLLPGFIIKYGINRNLFFIFFVLLVSGVFGVFQGLNTFALFFKVFTGLVLSYYFYYYVILDFKFNIEQLFKWYLRGAYIVSLLGLMQLGFYVIGFEEGYWFWHIFNKWSVTTGGAFGIRINSVFAEPTHLAAVLSAAFFVSLYNIFRREKFHQTNFQSVVIILVYFLSFSGLAQTGIFLSLLFMAVSFGFVRYIIVAVPVGIVLFNILYNNVPEFRQRLDGLISLNAGEKFVLGKTHGSSFILYNNAIVALENFKTNFVFGSGIGSHPIAFEKYTIAREIKAYGFNLNSADANSMFLRLVSETGLFGVLIFLIIIVKCYVLRNETVPTNHWLISNAILILILLNMFRQGHYFLNGFPFFVILYYFNYISYRNFLETGQTLYEQTISEEAAESLKIEQV